MMNPPEADRCRMANVMGMTVRIAINSPAARIIGFEPFSFSLWLDSQISYCDNHRDRDFKIYCGIMNLERSLNDIAQNQFCYRRPIAFDRPRSAGKFKPGAILIFK